MDTATQSSTKDFELGGSIFWILIVLVALGGLSYLGIWSFHNDSVAGGIIASIFFAMIVAGILMSKFEIFSMGTWGENSLSFAIGFAMWATIGAVAGSQSVLSVAENHLFSTIASQLPVLVEVLMNNFVIPIAEEMFWMIAIPWSLISIMNTIGKSKEIFSSPYLQIPVVVIVSGLSFALFHVGKAATYFLIAAFIFRGIVIILVYGDQQLDILKKLNLVVAFSLGAHIANNVSSAGIRETFIILNSNFWSIGWIVYAILLAIIAGSIDQVIKLGSKS
jgi:hypothetical protein